MDDCKGSSRDEGETSDSEKGRGVGIVGVIKKVVCV